MPTNVKGRRPLYLDVADALKTQIEEGRYRVGDYMPPERELVTEFACSRATIRLAIDMLISQEIAERRPKRGVVIHGVPSTGRGEIAQLSGTVSIIFPSANWHINSMRVLNGCQSSLYQNSTYAIVCDSGYLNLPEGMHKEVEHLESMMAKGVKGIIFWPAYQQSGLDVFLRAQAAGVSIVLVDRQIPGFDCDFVGVDNVDGAYQATMHLISHGHKRIAHVTHPALPTSLTQRIEGYRKALEEAGIEYDERMVVGAWAHSDMEQIGAALKQLLSLDNPPTAIFCATDQIASAVIGRLHNIGIAVPGDMAIVGFDDDFYAKLSPIPITTVEQPFETIGQEAVRLLMSRLRDKTLGPPKKVILPVKIILRQSCGSPDAHLKLEVRS
ncbi:MAG: GntR family transcriptional regulator [Armatimonadota bacterium]|nr:GntR family transcriptional regulator [Armatimonadota bacterium]